MALLTCIQRAKLPSLPNPPENAQLTPLQNHDTPLPSVVTTRISGISTIRSTTTSSWYTAAHMMSAVPTLIRYLQP
ncbi:hypothetical protein M407DRAFT_243746 [Tulasnella calospora MUT 4182]|uniref:Uncharacterized protein n=1 Tax=Tulasnella calospora MUT 4182 TaxID=1051891 RepID=A0A0C3LY72_9AGAM|nr:hypothetical protein M407DRAFT_243746 [Tulasnella calospora MUT 4182]